MTEDRAKDCAAMLTEVGGTEVTLGQYIPDWYGLNERLGRPATQEELSEIAQLHWSVSGCPPGWNATLCWDDYSSFLEEWRWGFRDLTFGEEKRS